MYMCIVASIVIAHVGKLYTVDYYILYSKYYITLYINDSGVIIYICIRYIPARKC